MVRFDVSKALLSVAIGGASASEVHLVHTPGYGDKTGVPFDGFVSFSIELSSFPEYAGNHSHPNTFSYNLLSNLENILGHYPYIRVGGNTQDYALYNASQREQLVGIVNPSRSPDYPTTITIGPSFFEGYDSWPGVQFSHGLNLGLGGNNSAGWKTLVDTVPLACKALSHGNLYTWEYGNEPDLYSTSAQGPVRPYAAWTEEEYVKQWQNGTDAITRRTLQSCPFLGKPRFMAPSFAGVSNRLNATLAWWAGLDKKQDVAYFSTHNYISGATVPGVTLQGTLLNHTRTMESVDAHIAEYDRIFGDRDFRVPLIFGETNSLYNQGKPGLSNSFGAALWGVEFNLYSASVGFKRVHMHQGTNYRYQSWQPVGTDLATIGTKAPYYGNIAVAHMLGSFRDQVSITNIKLGSDPAESAYAAHRIDSRHSNLARIMVLNLHSYNTTVDGAGLDPLLSPAPRPVRRYDFAVANSIRDGSKVHVQRLLANGSDAITGITFDGYSYNWDLKQGKPARLDNVTIGEVVTVRHGIVSVDVPDSSGALLSF